MDNKESPTMLRSPSNPILNRTKSCSMYEVRGKLIGIAVFIGFIVLVIHLIPSSSEVKVKPSYNKNQVYTYKNNYERPVEPKLTVEDKVSMTMKSDVYTVVFDAGSTGSRVHVYHFKTGNGPLKLVKELFKQVKPGLSSYADDPKKGAESLRELLNIALAEVPSELQSKTPISLMATAGLRLLPEGKADNLLKEVRVILKEYPFKLADDGVAIMDGEIEGIYSWMTVAFLKGDLSGATSNVATLDMGGGSTQITFAPVQEETLNVPEDFRETIELFKKKMNLYTHSYLGYGLMATRYKLIGGKKNKDNKEKLKSVCLAEQSDTVFPYGGVVFNVSGESQSSFNSCYIATKNFVSEKIKAVYELQKHKINVFSYFFDAAVDSGLIDPDVTGEIMVGDFRRAAKKAFDFPSEKKPFLGLDLMYMYSLLADGYRLRPKTKISIIKKIDNVEVSWGLGAAFKLLSSSGMIS